MPRAGLAATFLVACLGAAAYAAAGGGGRDARAQTPADLQRPRITRHPEHVSLSRRARFEFRAPKAARFECRLDSARWSACDSPHRLRRLSSGAHRFAVRGLDRRGRHGRASGFAWRVVEPKPFSIAQVGQPADLYPGAAPAPLPVAVANPNPAPILITALQVGVVASPAGCEAGLNLELVPAGVTAKAPLRVQPGETVSLPARGVSAPAIALRELPVNQDACQGGRFTLVFTGKAHG